jgi:serine/threonine protein kinase/tetratricopeptide (TPR) repeat protein/class 3 adenylate cyclase
MTPDRWKRIDQLLDALLELDPARRSDFLDKSCADDEILRRELESLLSAHGRSEGFIDTLRSDAAAELFGLPGPENLLDHSISHYRVMSLLGSGGMGEVYLARDTTLGRPVALKLLAGDFTRDGSRVKRFQQEASAASALNHPGILTVYEIGQHEDLHFIATEYVEGETLRQRFQRSPMHLVEMLDTASQIAGALTAAHSAGIVHRDIKPENIMLRPDGLVKVLDFGVAKLTQNTRLPGGTPSPAIVDVRTETGSILGTVPYMSPEQLRALEVDSRSDIFSLGIVLYEMVSGGRPFYAESPPEELVAILEKEPLPLDAPAELDQIVRKALKKDREQRYQTAAAMQADIKNLLRQIEADGQQLLICPLCKRQNSALFGFCANCGTGLKKNCPKCKGEIPVANEFCGLCGHRFRSSDETIQTRTQTGALATGRSGERRRATIVYSIVSGCSAILEQLDPQEADREIGAIKSAIADVITRHGGAVSRCTGEEMVALFGVPASYEDDYLRAVRAALELHSLRWGFSADLERRLGQPFTAYTGISSGPVVARINDDQTPSVSGDALHVASRLAGHAEANEILVSSETQRLIQPFFRLQAKGSLSIRPTAEPVAVYRVDGETGVHTRLQAAEIIGLTRYIGRTEELGALKSASDRAHAGEGQFVTVLGDAGVGKSRLLLEFLRTLEGRSINIFQSRCHVQGSKTPYLPFIDLLRDLLGLKEEPPELVRASAISTIKAIDASLETYIPIYLHLLSIENIDDSPTSDLKGDDLSLAIQEALSAVLTLHARSAPQLILLEDWHWADDASSEVLKRVAGLIAVHPLMIITTSRPERAIGWAYVENHTVLNLGPLNESASVQIIESIIGSGELPEGLGDLLYRRTGGNPFFIEEVCRSLVDDATVRVVDGVAKLESSLEDLNLPDTVQSLIRTRLDNLDADSQTLLRHASVLGREFNLRIVERMVGNRDMIAHCLDILQKQGLIQQIRVLPENIYRFKHVMTQEVVYDSLLLHQRKALHEAAGVAIEELYNGRVDEQLELLTFHYSRAENWPKAVRFGRESAEKASRLSRFNEALAMLEQTEAWWSKLDHTPEWKQIMVEILLAQERQCETLGLRDQQQDLIDRAFSFLATSDDQALLAETLVRQGELCTLLGCFDRAESALDQALAIRRAQSDSIGERIVLRNMGFLRWSQGRYEDAVDCNKTALAIDLKQSDPEGYSKDLTNLASILRSQGKAKEALEYVEEALKVNETINRPFSQGYTLTVAANVFRDLGEPDKAKLHYQRAIELTAQHRLPLHQVIIVSALASLCWERGEFDEGLRLNTDLVELTRRLDLKRELAQALAVLSQRLLELDRLAEALQHLLEAADMFSHLGDSEEHIRTLTSIAYVYERCGSDAPAALAAWEHVASLQSVRGNAAGELEALEGKARVARNLHLDLTAALGYYDRALEVAERIDDASKQGDLLNTMGIIEWGRFNFPGALDYYERALGVFQKLGDIVHAGLILNSIGVTLHNLGRTADATEHLRQALQLHRRSGQRLLEGHALAALGDIFDQTLSLNEAREHYAASLDIRREINDHKGEGWMSHHLARVLFLQGRDEQAMPLLNRATAIAVETGDQQLRDACTRLQS